MRQGIFRSLVLAGLVCGLLAGCAGTSLVSGSGGFFEGHFDIGRHHVPLPEGRWRLVGHDVYRTAFGEPFADVQLVQVDEARRELKRGVMISANLDPLGKPLMKPAGFCDPERAYYHQVVSRAAGSDQDCWVLSYFRAAAGRNTDPVSAQALAYLYRERIRVPAFAVHTTYRLGSPEDSLTVQYYFNPEYGTEVASAPAVAWQRSPWHMAVYREDPEKAAYVERLREWSHDWYDEVKLGFAMN